jgi:hypothetical protein
MATVWDESYPPSVLHPEPPPIVPTGATAGTPGAWTPAGAEVPATLAAANALGLTLGAAWTGGTWVDLAGGADTHWDGAAFVAGVAAAVEGRTTKTGPRKRGADK